MIYSYSPAYVKLFFSLASSACKVIAVLYPRKAYSAPSLESPLSVRATISLFKSAKNPNFNTVFAYWYCTTGGICDVPMCIDHLNKP